MKQTIIRQFFVLVFIAGASLADAQVDNVHSHPEYEEQNHTDAASEHDAQTNSNIEVVDHSQHGSQSNTSEAQHQHMAEVMHHAHPDYEEQNHTDAASEHDAQTDSNGEVVDHSHHGSGMSESSISTSHEQHGAHSNTSEAQHQHMAEAMAHEAMSSSMKESEEAGSLRDPNAYSNGYELSSGPYLLEPSRKISLADSKNFVGLWVDRFEYVESHDFDATEFEGHVWMGDSYNRFLLRSEVEIVNDSVETAEIDFLHTRAISPFWNVQFGLRREIGAKDERNWASIGLSGLAPYWFEVDASLFLSENGNALFDIEAEYDLLLTQRLVIQPRIDVHSYGKSDKEMGRGSGLSILKTGFRLRYEFDRQLAPYLGYERVIKFGETAELLPPDEGRADNHWILGFKFWF